MSDLKCLTTKEVARLCRVSDATVKRWEDLGVLKSERTNGGHRRFRAEEVARFQRQQGLGLKYSYGLDSAAQTQTHRRETSHQSQSSLFQMLVAGDEEGVANLLISAHLHDVSLTEIFDNLICSAMKHIGELWYEGELTIAQEHLATRAAFGALYKLRQTLPIPEIKGKFAITCGIEADYHELPAYLAQITFESIGWEVLNFGANTPLYSLTEEVLRLSPEIVCISGTIITDFERLMRDYKNFREQTSKLKTSVILGGRIFADEHIRRRFPAEFYAGSFADVNKFVKTLTKKQEF